MKRILHAALLVMVAISFNLADASAASKPKYKPFVLASSGAGNMAATVADVSAKLKAAGLEIVGTHSPYPTATILVVTNDAMKKAAAKSKHGGFGAAQRVSITDHKGKIQVAYTNPYYMAGAYRMESDLGFAAKTLEKALGKKEEYGMDGGMSVRSLRDYHYMFGMEYFTDPHYLSRFLNHAEALASVEKGLAAGTSGITKVYRIEIPGKDEVLFGIAMNGAKGAGDQQDDTFLMKEIDFKDIRSSAHLPYEMLVTGNRVYALSARFRIAISFPDLSMMGDHSFMNIMDSPNTIKAALISVAGDVWAKK
jgi:hypothetical protein